MKIRRIRSDLLASNMYLVAEDSGVLLIDPCRAFDLPETVRPDFVFLTHEHYDHISGVNLCRDRYGMPVICTARCDERMGNSRTNMARYFEAFCRMQVGLDAEVPADFEPNYVCRADETFEADKEISWRGHRVRLLLLPGHSPGSSGLWIDGHLFSGDSIFARQETVLRFPGGSAVDWEKISLPKLCALPPDTIVYPGHFDPFPLKEWMAYL
ncbi:MAG: MBL fold metallo-hydrolase [Oscillospiraceae bacterium]|nr:MBL fold metallo-hydrolase [Oscillospiraceae bacterium]